MSDSVSNELSDNLTDDEIQAINAKHDGHKTCVRFFIDGDPHQYCEDCDEAMYFVNFWERN